jgi:hypothetical protein
LSRTGGRPLLWCILPITASEFRYI